MAQKVSEIKAEDIANYIRLDEVSEDDTKTLNDLIAISKSFIEHYTGHTEKELDDYPDFAIVVYILCQDMWDNRTLYVDNSYLNKVVETILGLHSVNLL